MVNGISEAPFVSMAIQEPDVLVEYSSRAFSVPFKLVDEFATQNRSRMFCARATFVIAVSDVAFQFAVVSLPSSFRQR